MISPEIRVQIRRYFYAEHWKIGTIATALNVHPDTVRRAIEVERFQHAEPLRPSMVDPYLPFVREVLEQYPRLRATRLHQMIRDRGYTGSVEQLRRVVALQSVDRRTAGDFPHLALQRQMHGAVLQRFDINARHLAVVLASGATWSGARLPAAA